MEIIKDIIILIMCHLIGDYVLQSRFVADTKGSNWYHLFVHSILYIIPFCFLYGIIWQSVVVCVLHFIIDALKARYDKITYIQDQVAHYILTLLYLI